MKYMSKGGDDKEKKDRGESNSPGGRLTGSCKEEGKQEE